MTKYEVVPATIEHAIIIAEKMRQEDKDELWVAVHLRPFEGVMKLMMGSRDPKVGLVDGEVVCVWGVVRPFVLSDTGYPWMLATPAIFKNPLGILRRIKEQFDLIKERYELLENYGDVRNEHAHRWMKWLGFKRFSAVPWGVEQLPFYRFEIRRSA